MDSFQMNRYYENIPCTLFVCKKDNGFYFTISSENGEIRQEEDSIVSYSEDPLVEDMNIETINVVDSFTYYPPIQNVFELEEAILLGHR